MSTAGASVSDATVRLRDNRPNPTSATDGEGHGDEDSGDCDRVAGPSSARSQDGSRSQIPDTEAIDPAESASIQRHLDRRRKSSIIPGSGRKAAKAHARLRSGSDVSTGSHVHTGSPTVERDPAWFEQMNDVDEAEAEGEDGAEGIERSLTFDMEEMRRRMPEAVKLFHDGEDYREVDLDQGLKQGYAWDVLFENQRGIHFLGKAYFSSNSLLPADPSPYTLPSYPLPSATTLVVAETDGAERTEHSVKTSRPWHKRPTPQSTSGESSDAQRKSKSINLSSSKRSIKTAYSLATFQCPGPQWNWVGPWMINMKVGTDEGGWRYNAWFKNDGWRNHAGPAGWWGWVRRREWVRLRMISGIDGEAGGVESGEAVKAGDGSKGTSTPRGHRKDLLEVLREAREGEGGERVIKYSVSFPLDREELAWWEAGMDKVQQAEDDATRAQLRDLFADQDNVDILHQAFTYRSTYVAFVQLLEKYGYALAEPPSAPSSRSPPEPTPVSPRHVD